MIFNKNTDLIDLFDIIILFDKNDEYTEGTMTIVSKCNNPLLIDIILKIEKQKHTEHIIENYEYITLFYYESDVKYHKYINIFLLNIMLYIIFYQMMKLNNLF